MHYKVILIAAFALATTSVLAVPAPDDAVSSEARRACRATYDCQSGKSIIFHIEVQWF
jgi:hypothetical protein